MPKLDVATVVASLVLTNHTGDIIGQTLYVPPQDNDYILTVFLSCPSTGNGAPSVSVGAAGGGTAANATVSGATPTPQAISGMASEHVLAGNPIVLYINSFGSTYSVSVSVVEL